MVTGDAQDALRSGMRNKDWLRAWSTRARRNREIQGIHITGSQMFLKPKLQGSVSPPEDLQGVAKQELGELYEELISRHGEGFSAKQYVRFIEEIRNNGPRIQHDSP